jgi:hypothetical protein
MDFLIDPYVYPPPPYIGFHAPLSADDQDIISPIADALSNGSPNYISGWCRLSGDTQQIRWRPVSEAAANAKLGADGYTQKVTYKCRMRKGTTPSTTGSTTFRFFSVYNDNGYSGFLMGNSGQVKYVDYRVFVDPPLTNSYEDFVASGPDSVYEMRYDKGSPYMKFFVDDLLVYTSLFPARIVGNGITIRTADAKFDFLEFKDCQMVIG